MAPAKSTALTVAQPIQVMAKGHVLRPRELDDSDIFLTIKDVIARWRGLTSPKTLAHWRATKMGPKFKRLGNRILYRLDWIKAYEESDGYKGRAKAA